MTWSGTPRPTGCWWEPPGRKCSKPCTVISRATCNSTLSRSCTPSGPRRSWPRDRRSRPPSRDSSLPQSGDSLAEGRALGYDFLTWLWYFAETTGGRLPLPDNREVEIQPGEHLVLSHPDNGRERIVCTTPAVSLHEARTGLQQGKRVEQIQIYMKVGENEYFLKLDTDLWALRGVKTPRQERDPGEDEEDGLFLERMYFLEEIFAGLDAAYGSFLSQRLGEQWDRKGPSQAQRLVRGNLLTKLCLKPTRTKADLEAWRSDNGYWLPGAGSPSLRPSRIRPFAP